MFTVFLPEHSLVEKLREIQKSDKDTRKKFFQECKFWVCLGKPDNVIRSIELSIKLRGFTYWGVRTEDIENLVEGLERARGGALTNYKNLLKKFLGSEGRYNIIFLGFADSRKYVAAGIVTSIEFSRYDVIWCDEEREENKLIYPYRLRIFLIWIHEPYLQIFKEMSVDKVRHIRSGISLEYTLPSRLPGLHPVADDKKHPFVEFLSENINLPSYLFSNRYEHDMNVYELQAHGQGAKTREQQATKISVPFKDFIKEFFRFSTEDEYILEEIESCIEDERCAMLFRGPPGSGKTELARLIARYLGYRLVEVTCHQYMTRCELIGDFVLKGNDLTYRPGALVKALAAVYDGENGVVILLDELNRVDFDKVASELMTILGSPEWRVPESLISQLEEASLNNEIAKKALEVLRDNDYRIPPRKIIFIATINSFDTVALFRLGYATLRRFRVIDVLWSKKTIEMLLDGLLDSLSSDISSKVKKLIEDLLSEVENAEGILQPGILIKFVNTLRRLLHRQFNTLQALTAALRETVLYQVSALSENAMHKLIKIFEQHGLHNVVTKVPSLWPSHLLY